MMRYRKGRVEALQRRMDESGIDVALIGSSADMEYLLGGRLPLTERLNLLAVPRRGAAWLLLPKLQAPLVDGLAGELDAVIWDEDRSPIELAAQSVLERSARTVGVDGHMW